MIKLFIVEYSKVYSFYLIFKKSGRSDTISLLYKTPVSTVARCHTSRLIKKYVKLYTNKSLDFGYWLHIYIHLTNITNHKYLYFIKTKCTYIIYKNVTMHW